MMITICDDNLQVPFYVLSEEDAPHFFNGRPFPIKGTFTNLTYPQSIVEWSMN